MKKVGFICVHNSCRSQIAEFLGNLHGKEFFESYSAGTEIKANINQDAVRIINEMYGVNMEEKQYSKLISDIPKLDIVIKMGCNVVCPYVVAEHIEDWGIEDPTGKSDEEFRDVILNIESKIFDLIDKIKHFD